MKESKVARKPAGRGKKVEPPRRRVMPARPPAQEKAVEQVTVALKLFGKRDLTRARDAFRDLIGEFPMERELGDRARTYIQICERQIQPQAPRLRDADDYYHQGVVLLNQHNFEEALKMFEKALSIDPASEKARYTQAAAFALAARRDECLESLKQAIEASSVNRVRAANDPDFEALRDDADFRRIVFREGGDPA